MRSVYRVERTITQVEQVNVRADNEDEAMGKAERASWVFADEMHSGESFRVVGRIHLAGEGEADADNSD